MPKPNLSQRPRINAKNPELHSLTSETWDALEEINHPPKLFAYGDELALVEPSGEDPRVRSMDTPLLRYFLTRYIGFYQNDRNGGCRAARPPADLLQNLLVWPNPPLPKLRGIVNVPVVARDGCIQIEPGYSSATELVYAPHENIRNVQITKKPSHAAVVKALELLREELLGDFPFTDNPSRAHAISALLLPFVRPMIDGPTPLHLISKPKAGTGATLLGNVLCVPGVGQPSSLTFPGEEAEARRTLLSVLRGAPGAVILDNVHRLAGSALASCLTDEVFQDRLIGSSILLRVPNRSLWIATGNNPGMSDEIARRTVAIDLDAKSEHPDLRTGFRHPNLLRWARDSRAALVDAALTLIQFWISEGMPLAEKTLGGFESWSQVMGGILHTSGLTGFLEGLETSRGKVDIETEDFHEFVQQWAERIGDREVTASELLAYAPALDLGTGTEQSRSSRLGKLLERRNGQRFGEWSIKKKAALISGRRLWRLTRAQ
jgi:hypothetical protein